MVKKRKKSTVIDDARFIATSIRSITTYAPKDEDGNFIVSADIVKGIADTVNSMIKKMEPMFAEG